MHRKKISQLKVERIVFDAFFDLNQFLLCFYDKLGLVDGLPMVPLLAHIEKRNISTDQNPLIRF